MDANEQPMNTDRRSLSWLHFSRVHFSKFPTDLNIQMKVFSDDAETFDFLADPASDHTQTADKKNDLLQQKK